MLKKCNGLLLITLTHLVNTSLDHGIFPGNLNVNIFKPLFRSGDDSSFDNCRPLSLQPSFSKPEEKIIQNRLQSLLINKKLLDKFQHGFIKIINKNCSGRVCKIYYNV
jgi:hypothetical protein